MGYYEDGCVHLCRCFTKQMKSHVSTISPKASSSCCRVSTLATHFNCLSEIILKKWVSTTFRKILQFYVLKPCGQAWLGAHSNQSNN